MAQHVLGTQQGHDFGDIPVLSGAAETVTHPAMAGIAQLGLLLEASANAAKAATGGVEAANARFNPAMGLFPDAPGSRLAAQSLAGYEGAQGNPYARGLAANEAGASGNEVAQGLINQFYDPSNYLGVAGKAAQGTKLGSLLSAVDRAQGLPLEGLLGKLGQMRAAREAADEAGKVAARGAIDLPLAPSTANLRGYLKDIGLPAPKALKPEPSALAPKDFSIIRAAKQIEPTAPPQYPNALNFMPREAVTPAEEAAAKLADYGPARGLTDLPPETTPPDFPTLTGTRRELLAGLSKSDLSRLVSTAYNDVPKAIGNARNARPDPVDLAERAIERITQSDKLVARLQQRAPDLAAWVAELPDPVAIADEPVQAAQQLGGDIAAGGGDKLLPYAGGLGAANRAIGGALAGGAVGGVTGALTNEDDRLGGAAKGAAAGALLGGNVGTASPLIRHLAAQVVADPATWGKRAEGRLLADPQILADTLTAVRRARGETNTGVRGLQEAWNAFIAQWKRQAVDTAKQLPQDATYRATVNWGIAGEEFGVKEADSRAFQRAVSREKATGAISLDDPYNQVLIQSGHADLLTRKSDLIGADFTDAVTDKGKRNPVTGLVEQGAPRFGRLGSAIAGSVIGMGSALKSVNPVSPIFGAVRGLVDTEWSAGLHHLIGVANDSWREAMANAGTRQRLASVADDFLAKLEANGVDTAALQGRGGLFSGDEVAAVAGRQAGDDWHTLGETTIRQVGDRVATIAGDFRDKLAKDYTGKVTSGDRLLGQAERAAGKFAPFARWQIRSTPVLLEVAARHPVATFKALQETQRLGEEAKARGKRAYQAGYDITTETPLLGAVARARLGGKAGTWTLNPLGAVVPYGEALAGGEDTPDDATAYQRVAEALGSVGFGPSPLIQAGAYVAGQDYRAPGSLSRTAGLEGLGALLPGVGDIKLPTGRNLLDAARGVVEPALADAGIKTTGPASATDPVARRYAELVFDKTGKPLGDKSMIHYLKRDTPEAQALMDQAVREEALMGAAGNAVSLTSPIPSTAQGADAAAAQAARKPVVEAQDLVETLPPVQGAMLQRQIDQYKAAHPESRVYDGTSARAQAQLLMADWERRHATLAWFPEIYDYQRQIAAEELGLVQPGTLAQKQRAIDERGGATAAPGVENRLRVDPGAAYRLRELNQVRR